MSHGTYGGNGSVTRARDHQSSNPNPFIGDGIGVGFAGDSGRRAAGGDHDAHRHSNNNRVDTTTASLHGAGADFSPRADEVRNISAGFAASDVSGMIAGLGTARLVGINASNPVDMFGRATNAAAPGGKTSMGMVGVANGGSCGLRTGGALLPGGLATDTVVRGGGGGHDRRGAEAEVGPGEVRQTGVVDWGAKPEKGRIEAILGDSGGGASKRRKTTAAASPASAAPALLPLPPQKGGGGGNKNIPPALVGSANGFPSPSSQPQETVRTCEQPGCRRAPCYAWNGAKKATLCASHRLPGQVNVVSKRCHRDGCRLGPSYAEPDEKKPRYCAGHRLPGHVNVVSPRCQHDGCSRGPSYGMGGDARKPIFCAGHRMHGMVNVVSPQCQEPSCTKGPCYGFEGQRASYCAKHKLEGQVNVVSRRCKMEHCMKGPSYGEEGDRRASYCAKHKQDG